MPRVASELARVASTKLSNSDFDFLQGYARYCYNTNYISQPTISHVLRYVVKRYRIWAENDEKRRQEAMTKLTQDLLKSDVSTVSPKPKESEQLDNALDRVN